MYNQYLLSCKSQRIPISSTILVPCSLGCLNRNTHWRVPLAGVTDWQHCTNYFWIYRLKNFMFSRLQIPFSSLCPSGCSVATCSIEVGRQTIGWGFLLLQAEPGLPRTKRLCRSSGLKQAVRAKQRDNRRNSFLLLSSLFSICNPAWLLMWKSWCRLLNSFCFTLWFHCSHKVLILRIFPVFHGGLCSVRAHFLFLALIRDFHLSVQQGDTCSAAAGTRETWVRGMTEADGTSLTSQSETRSTT